MKAEILFVCVYIINSTRLVIRGRHRLIERYMFCWTVSRGSQPETSKSEGIRSKTDSMYITIVRKSLYYECRVHISSSFETSLGRSDYCRTFENQ